MTPGFGFYLRPSYCSLGHMQSPVSGLDSLLIKRTQARGRRQDRLRRFDEAIARFMDRNLNRHFFKVCHGAQAVGARASHEISHMRRRCSALSDLLRSQKE